MSKLKTTPENKTTARKLLPGHFTIADFAAAKSVGRATVYNHINNKKIIPDLVGMKLIPMIDWRVYADYTFAEPKWNAETYAEKQKKTAHHGN